MQMVGDRGCKGPHYTGVGKYRLEVATWIRGQDRTLLASPWPSGDLGFLVYKILT